MRSVKDSPLTYGLRHIPAQMGKKMLVLAVLLVSLLHLSAQAVKIPPLPDPPRLVNDLAGMLSVPEVAALEEKLTAYDDSTSTQIVVVTIPTLDGAEANQYATELFHAWGIGQKRKNNGTLLFISKEEHKLFLLTGRGVEEFLPDAICKRIVEQTIKPYFKAGNYAQGINAGVDEVMARLSGQFVNEDPKEDVNAGKPVKIKLRWIILAIIIIVVLASLFGNDNNGTTYSRSGTSNWWLLFSLFNAFGGSGRRGGGDWGGGGGGFGGFGGGDSGGGGAGGSW